MRYRETCASTIRKNMNIERIKEELKKRVNQKLSQNTDQHLSGQGQNLMKRWEVIQDEFYNLVREEKQGATQDDINDVFDLLRDDIFALSRAID